MGAQYSQVPSESDRSSSPNDSPVYENISEYQLSRLSTITECFDTWSVEHKGKRLITYSDFDNIFGPILGDPDEHFAIFTGDDLKRRMKAKAAAIAAFVKANPGLPSSNNSSRASSRKMRNGSFARGGSISSQSGGSRSSFDGGPAMAAAMNIGFLAAADSGMTVAKMALQASLAARAAQKTADVSSVLVDKYKKGGTIVDCYEVFAVLALLSDEELEGKVKFVFNLFARGGASKGGIDSKQFGDLMHRASSGIGKLLGHSPPDPKYADVAVLSLYGKPSNQHRQVLTFKDFWEWCQDEVEVAVYTQKILQYSLTESNMYKQETTVNTDSYLANSKLMGGDDDEPDENASGIAKARPSLYKDLVKHMSTKSWWEEMHVFK